VVGGGVAIVWVGAAVTVGVGTVGVLVDCIVTLAGGLLLLALVVGVLILALVPDGATTNEL
jgi:hypothetical protein